MSYLLGYDKNSQFYERTVHFFILNQKGKYSVYFFPTISSGK